MRTRSIRHRGRKSADELIDIDITSLLDALVIMLVFLLKSYNSSGVVINIPKDISIPRSASTSLNTSGINVQVSKESIYVDDKVVYTDENAIRKIDRMKTIYPLYDELVRKKEEIKRLKKQLRVPRSFSGRVNFILDKSIRYKTLQRLMHTSAASGFKTYKFVVLGEDN